MVFRIQGTQQTKVKQSIEKLNDQLQSFKKSKKLSFQILGPSPCLIEKMRNLYRWQILIKYPPSFSLQSLVRQHLYGNRSQWLSTGLRLMVDVDPMRVI